jgi:hypothetical protein
MSARFRYNALIKKAFEWVAWAVPMTLAFNAGVMAEEDPYLSAISQEAKKLEAEGQPTLSESGSTTGETEEGLNLRAFEEDLKTRHKGSYTFYQKLPLRSREEVFQEYRDGASIDELRQTIMQRFLQR